jgi:hypothetical protein
MSADIRRKKSKKKNKNQIKGVRETHYPENEPRAGAKAD